MGKRELRLILPLVLLFCMLALFVAFRSTARADPGAIFSDGFESGDFTAWTSTTAASGTNTVNTDKPNSGAYAYEASTTSDYGYAFASKDLTGTTQTNVRIYVEITSTTVDDGGFWAFLYPEITPDFYYPIVGVENAARNLYMAYYDNSFVRHQLISTTTLSLDTYYCVELEMKLSATDTQYRVYLNGIEVTDLTVTGMSWSWSAYPPNRISIGVAAGDDYSSASHSTAYFDDVAVADSYIGQGTIQVTFDQTGLSSDFPGTVVAVDGINYSFLQLPASFWWNASSSHNFAYQSPLVASVNEKQYVWSSTDGTLGETVQNGSIVAGASGTVVGNYVTQYYVTFEQTGVDPGFGGNVMNVNGTDYGSTGYSSWFDYGASVPFNFYSPLVVTPSREQCVFVIANDSSPLTVLSAETVTGNYTIQWNVTFDQSGVGIDFTGTVVTIDGANYTAGDLPYSLWADDGSNHTFAYQSPLVVDPNAKQYAYANLWLTSEYLSGPLSIQNSSGEVDGWGIFIGNYSTQYPVSFDQSGSGAAPSVTYSIDAGSPVVDTVPFTVWINDSSSISYSYDSIVPGSIGTKYVLIDTSPSSPQTITAALDVTGTYKTQYYVTFAQSDLDGSASGTVLTVNGTAKAYGEMPFSEWVNETDVLDFSFESTVSSSTVNKQFILSGVDASSPLTVTGAQTITGSYGIQWYVTFGQSGLDGTATGNVVTVNGSAITDSSLPYSLWVNSSDTINYSYQVIVSSTISSQRFRHYSTTGLSSPITVTGPTSVTGNYVTQYNVTFAQSGVDVDFSDSVMNIYSVNYSRAGVTGWYDSGANVTFSYYSPLTVTPDVKQYVLTGVSGNTTASSLIVSAATTVTGTYGTQWYIIITSAHGSPTEASQWVDDGSGFIVSVTNPDVIVPSAHQWNLTGLAVDGAPQTLSDSVNYASVHASHTIVFSWTEQWYVTFDWTGLYVSASGNLYLTVNGSAVNYPSNFTLWIDSGDSIIYTYQGIVSSSISGKQFRLYSVTGPTSPIIVTASVTVTGNYVSQYQLTMSANFGTTSPSIGDHWFDYGSIVNIEAYSPSTNPQERYVWNGWTGTGNESYTGSTNQSSVTMYSPITESAFWTHQYQVSFVITPSGSGSSAPAGTNVWEDAGSLPISALATPGYTFSNWSSDTGSITFVDSTFPATTTMISGPGNITVTFEAANATLTVRGDNDRIYYRSYNWTTTSWGDWNELPAGTTTDSPATAICGGKQYFIVRGDDHISLWFSWINLTDDSFSGWTWMPGSTPSTPTLITNGTALILVVRGSDNTIYYRVYDVQTQTWNDWNGLPAGTTCDKVGAAILGQTLQLVVRGFSTTDANINNTLWYGYMDLTSGTFSGWTFLPGSTPSTPVLTAWGSNNLTLVVRGDDNTLYINTFNGTSWQGWTGLSSGSTLESPAATVTSDTLVIVVVGMDGNTLWQSSLDLTTSSFSGWTWITGSTPSPPILTS